MNKREETPYFRECQKLGGLSIKNVYLSPTKAATYLYLLNHCDKKTALQFSKRRICKWDTTSEYDGPSTHRLLCPENIKEKCINGWANVGFEVFYKNKETIADKKLLSLDQENDKIQEQLEKNEQDKEMIYSLNTSDPNFKQKVIQFKENLQRQRNKPLQYVKKNGVKFVELLSELKAADQRGYTILQKFNTFNQQKASEFQIKEKLPERLYNKQNRKFSIVKKSIKFLRNSKKYNFPELTQNKSNSQINPFTQTTQITQPSLLSISMHKKTFTEPTNEINFENELEEFANKMIEYKPYDEEIVTQNIQQLQKHFESLKTLCMKKINSQHRSINSSHRSTHQQTQSLHSNLQPSQSSRFSQIKKNFN